MNNGEILTSLKQREQELLEIVEKGKNAQKELTPIQKAIKAMEELAGTAVNERTGDADFYDPGFTLKEKIKASLAALGGKGLLQEIHAHIIEQEPEIDSEKLYRNLTTTLYQMAKNGDLGYRSVDNKKMYRLKD